MRLDEFYTAVAVKNGLSFAQARKIVRSALDELVSVACREDRLIIPGFGTISSRVQKSRTVRHLRTGQEITTREKRVPKLKFAESVREKVAGDVI